MKLKFTIIITIISLASISNAQMLRYNFGYNIVFEDNANVRAEPSLNSKVIATLPHFTEIEFCRAHRFVLDTINGMVNYWQPILVNDSFGYIWGSLLSSSYFKSMMDVDDEFLVGFNLKKEMVFKVFNNKKLQYEVSFPRNEKQRIAAVETIGETYNSNGNEVLAVKYLDNSFELFEWTGKEILPSKIKLRDESYITGEFIDIKYCLTSKHGVNLRTGADINSKIVATLPFFSKLTLVKENFKYDTIKGKTGFWHQVAWKDDTVFIWHKLLARPVRYIKSNRYEDIDFFYTTAAIYVLKNEKVIHTHEIKYYHRGEYFYEKGCMGLDQKYHFIAIEVMAHACGHAGGEEIYYWDGEKLKYICFDYGIGDGGYYEDYSKLFPYRIGGIKGKVVSRSADGESVDFPPQGACDENYRNFIYHSSTQIMEFDGDTLIEVPSKHKTLKDYLKRKYPKHNLMHYTFGDINNDGIEDAIAFMLIDPHEWDVEPTGAFIAILFGKRKGKYEVYKTNSSIVYDHITFVDFEIEGEELIITTLYHSGLWADRGTFPQVEEFVFRFDVKENELVWFSKTESEVKNKDRWRDGWDVNRSFFKTNKVLFEDAWSNDDFLYLNK
jgi:hypothetical protein